MSTHVGFQRGYFAFKEVSGADWMDELRIEEAGDRLESLRGELAGELRLDRLHQLLYAQDASVYQEEPMGVAFPRGRADVQALVRTAGALGFSLIPRAAGTSLAGQCVGPGLVVDTGRYMNRILELNVEERWVRVEPGVVLDELNRFLEPHGLFFGPDTSTSNRCMIGGMIGNNSCGSHSILYGTTMHHVRELGVVFSDGEYALLQPWKTDIVQERMEGEGQLARGLRTLYRVVKEHRELIEERYPRRDLLRKNSGYPLDDLIQRRPFDEEGEEFSLARFFCGTEGTLGLTTEAKLNLVELPKAKILVCAHFRSLEEALRATVLAVEHEPAAAELMDRRILEQTKQNIEQARNRFWVEGDPDAVLVVEFYGADVSEVEEKAARMVAALEEAQMGYAHPIVRAPQDKAVWQLRKAGLGLLMGIEGDVKPVTVVEDTAVPVDELEAYIADFSEVMSSYGTACVYYAHASVGLLHLRPELNLKDPEDVERFKGIAEDVADLVKRYRGSLSGEHGDGRVRSPLLERFYGSEVVSLFEEIKEGFDPQRIFNPRKIVDPLPIDEGFRFIPGAPTPEVKTYFHFEAERGLVRATELCNGAGVCRKSAAAGGTMCPSYMVTREERDSTRGRANTFRALLTGDAPEEAFRSEEVKEALDLCLSCKGCKSECPANVDMAKLKAEFSQQYMDRKGVPWSAWLFANYGKLSRMGMIWPWFSNWMLSFGVTKWVMQRFFGIARERAMPRLASGSFDGHFKVYRGENPAKEGGEPVWLYIDPFTDFSEPEVGIAAVRVLEAAGYRVERFPIRDDGRTYLSKGMVRDARAVMESGLEVVQEMLAANKGRAVVGVEPSALLTFRDEMVDLVREDYRSAALDLKSRSFLLDEFLVQEQEAGRIRGDLFREEEAGKAILHGHCHQKALVGTGPTEKVLAWAGYEVRTLPTGCCGMAGSFGYEADHYGVSMEIGELVLFPALRDAEEGVEVVAPGTSCRHQIADGVGRQARHPALVLADRLRSGEGERS